jgi:hypothetical protein
MDNKLVHYLASPYCHKDPLVMTARIISASLKAAELINKGICVYSPIAHNGMLVRLGTVEDGWEHWKEHDTLMLGVCDKLLIYRLPEWEKSVGIAGEIEEWNKLDRPPIEYLDPTEDDMKLIPYLDSEYRKQITNTSLVSTIFNQWITYGINEDSRYAFSTFFKVEC